MGKRTGMVLCILIGSFCVYCGQSAMTELGHDGGVSSGGTTGAVGNAMGDTCCSAPAREQPTVIWDDLVSPAPIPNTASSCTLHTPVFDVSGYRRVVIHAPSCAFSAQVRNGKAGFVMAAEHFCPSSNSAAPAALPSVMTVEADLGHDLRVVLHSESPFVSASLEGDNNCQRDPVPVTIVGYKNP